MSGPVQAVAPGKVNLCFRVGPLREDGYHSVASLYAAVDQLETVQLELDPQRPAGSVGCELRVVAGSLVAQQEAAGAFDLTLVPLDERNLAVRAAQAVLAEAPDLPSGLMLRIAKAVPVAGGMGGGSADAAAALSAAAELIARETGHAIARERLLEIGAGLGADVPFAMTGGAAVGTGSGTELRAVPVRVRWHGVLVADTGALSTPEVFATLDRMRAEGAAPTVRESELEVPAGLLRALAEGKSAVGGEALANDLQAPALRMSPELRRRLDELEELDARAMVSGSGPTIVALPRTSGHDDGAESSRVLAAQLRERGLCAVACTIG